MTLEEIVLFLLDESQEQTLTEATIRRCILLAYNMGVEGLTHLSDLRIQRGRISHEKADGPPEL